MLARVHKGGGVTALDVLGHLGHGDVIVLRGVGVLQRNPVVVVVVVTLALLHAHVAQASEGTTVVEPTACRGALDAVDNTEVRCSSPARVAAVVTADAVVVEAPIRDPHMFPGELAFGAGLFAAAGAVTLVATSLSPPASPEVNTGLQVGGIAALGLSGLLAGAAVSFLVFNPTTGVLQLPLFAGEPR